MAQVPTQRFYLLGEDGEPREVPAETWIGNPAAHVQIAYDPVGDGYVSTIFMGISYRHPLIHGDGPPIVWETMAFDGENRVLEARRYTSRADAEAGHAEILAALCGGMH